MKALGILEEIKDLKGFFRTITYLPHENPIFRTITYLAHDN